MTLQSAKMIGAGMATIGLTGVGVSLILPLWTSQLRWKPSHLPRLLHNHQLTLQPSPNCSQRLLKLARGTALLYLRQYPQVYLRGLRYYPLP
nr:ATP synthase F0 subunit 9 [Stylonema alsidii]